MNKKVIYSSSAPQAVGTYSQAIQFSNLVFLSGQLGVDPTSGNLQEGFEAQAHQVFRNLRSVCQAAGGEQVRACSRHALSGYPPTTHANLVTAMLAVQSVRLCFS